MAASKELRLGEIEGLVSQIQGELHLLTTGSSARPRSSAEAEEKRKKKEQERAAKKQKMLQERREKSERKRIQKLHRQNVVDITVQSSHLLLQSILGPSSSMSLSRNQTPFHLSSFCLFSSPALHGVGALGGYGTRSDLVASRASHITPIQKACNAAIKKLRKDSIQKIVQYLEDLKKKKLEEKKEEKKNQKKGEKKGEPVVAPVEAPEETFFDLISGLLGLGASCIHPASRNDEVVKKVADLVKGCGGDKKSRQTTATSILDALSPASFSFNHVIEPCVSSSLSLLFSGASKAFLFISIHQLHDLVCGVQSAYPTLSISDFANTLEEKQKNGVEVTIVALDCLNEDRCSSSVPSWCPWPIRQFGCIGLDEGGEKGEDEEALFLELSLRSQMGLFDAFPSPSPSASTSSLSPDASSSEPSSPSSSLPKPPKPLQYFAIDFGNQKEQETRKYVVDLSHISLSTGPSNQYWTSAFHSQR